MDCRQSRTEELTIDSTASKTITLPDAPDIKGLVFRHFKGDEDFPGILAVNSGSKIADGMDYDLHTLETITYSYSNTPNHDIHRDMLIAEVDGKMIAFSRVFMERLLEGKHIYQHVGFVLPKWRGKGIGSALIHWAEQRARQIEAEQDEDAEAFLGTGTGGKAAGLENLLKAGGYEPVRYSFSMRTPDLDHIPEAPMPEGLEIRPAKPEQYRTIWEASVEAFRDHWGAAENDEPFEVWLDHPFHQPELWVVAWDGDQVAGSILNFINREYNELVGRRIGYTEDISVRRPWRRRGLARAMLARSMKLLKELGMTQTALSVDTQNPSGALQLYESMGYEVIDTRTEYRKPL